MLIGSGYFKMRARAALKGNWQTALLVAFFSGVLVTVLNVAQSLALNTATTYLALGHYERYYQEVLAIPQSTWLGLAALSLLATVFTPALSLGANQYFIERVHGRELGFAGLFCRMRQLPRALWLYVYMGLRIFLWSLLFVVPGILAALRYSLAPCFMAQNPDMKAGEAIEKSKAAMNGMKMTYFSLQLSFVLWSLLASMAQLLLEGVNVVAALVVGQFLQLAVSTYLCAACAVFYVTVTDAGAMGSMREAIRQRMRQMGMDDEALHAAGLDESEPDGNRDAQERDDANHSSNEDDDTGGDEP